MDLNVVYIQLTFNVSIEIARANFHARFFHVIFIYLYF